MVMNIHIAKGREIYTTIYPNTQLICDRRTLPFTFGCLLETMTVSDLVKRSFSFCATRIFITFFTKSGNWVRFIQSTLHSVTWRCILVLSSHLLLGVPSGLLLSCILARTRYRILLSPTHATCPPISFKFIWLSEFFYWQKQNIKHFIM
jgi:hypothetical protein